MKAKFVMEKVGHFRGEENTFLDESIMNEGLLIPINNVRHDFI